MRKGEVGRGSLGWWVGEWVSACVRESATSIFSLRFPRSGEYHYSMENLV